MNKTEGFLVFNFENEKGFMQIFSERTVSLSCPPRLHSIRSIYFLLLFFLPFTLKQLQKRFLQNRGICVDIQRFFSERNKGGR